jgi:glycosyltransferase involved in cell wall biosynthesis
MRIIIIDHSAQFSGGQTGIIEFIRGVKIYFGAVEVYGIFNKNNSRLLWEATSLGALVSPFDYDVSILERLVKLTGLVKILSAPGAPTVIYGNTFEGGLWSGLLSKILSCKSVFRMRLSPIIFSHGLVDHVIFSLNDLLLANSEFVLEETHKRAPYTKRKASFAIYPPISIPIFVQRPINFGSAVNIGLIGRFETIKKQIHAIDVAKILINICGCRFKFHLFGSSDDRDNGYYRDLVRKKIDCDNLSEYIILAGDRSDLDSMYENLDICLTLSTSEALSRVIYEGGLRGCVNVASCAAGNTELVRHGVDGFLFEPDDWESCAHYLAILIENPRILREFSLAAVNKLSKIFDAEQTLAREMNLLFQI